MRQSTELKPVIFHPAAIAAIRLFPAEVRKELGKAVFDLQKGETLSMPLSRPMPSIRSGVEELRIRDRSGIYRTLCYTRSPRGILVIHAFVKTTQATTRRDMELGRKRLRELLDEKV
jgi:phage-related protein